MIISPTLNGARMRLVPPLIRLALATTAISRVVVEGASPVEVTMDDRVSRRDTPSITVNEYQINVSAFGGIKTEINYESSDVSIATVDSNGFITHVSDGTCYILVTANGASARKKITLSTSGGVETDTFLRYASGSLAKNITDNVDNRLVGKNITSNFKIFTTQNHTTQTYVRNSNCWAADIDLTGISPWNSSGGTNKAGVLVSPKSILFAAHYPISVGATVRFVKSDGTVVSRTMTARMIHPSYTPYYPDLCMGILDAPILEADGISFVKILPENWTTKITGVSGQYALPALSLDQEEKALVTNLSEESNLSIFSVPPEAGRITFHETVIGGDSGNPGFIIINDELVLLTVWTYQGAGYGSSVRYHKAALNSMMTALGDENQLTEIDLSSFPTY